jgi:hypothetical protein
MMSDDTRFSRAVERFDEVNAADPRMDRLNGEMHPRELVYARRMTDALARFEPDASEALRLAARAQHIQRWILPRSEFPDGRSGYKRWRTQLMAHHAEVASGILREVGYGDPVVERVTSLLRKQGLKRDPEVQTLEDVICLVFLEHYFDDFARDHEDEKLVEILGKTWAKMSERGRAAALELRLSEKGARLVRLALGG